MATWRYTVTADSMSAPACARMFVPEGLARLRAKVADRRCDPDARACVRGSKKLGFEAVELLTTQQTAI